VHRIGQFGRQSFPARHGSESRILLPLLSRPRRRARPQRIARVMKKPYRTRRQAGRREWLRLYLERFVPLPYSRRLCTIVGGSDRGRPGGYRIECADAWIAVTALRHDVALVTHKSRGLLERIRFELDFPRAIAPAIKLSTCFSGLSLRPVCHPFARRQGRREHAEILLHSRISGSVGAVRATCVSLFLRRVVDWNLPRSFRSCQLKTISSES